MKIKKISLSLVGSMLLLVGCAKQIVLEPKQETFYIPIAEM